MTAIRLRILELSMIQSALSVGQIEVDESYFGARRVHGKRGRGARGKTIVFGLLKRGDKVYTEIVLLYKRLSRVRRTLIVLFIQMVGVDKKMFNLHLKECEFRFNNRKQNIYRVLLGIFRKEPLKLS